MYRKLWEGEGNALFVELGIDGFLCIEEYAPVVGGIGPQTNGKGNTALCQCRYGYKRSRLLQDSRMGKLYFVSGFPVPEVALPQDEA